MPFSGYSSEAETYTAAVQIFTFSEQSLTRRGVMDHGTWVRRSFQADDTTTANLSEAELSLFDNSNPDQPLELGRAELAPNYSQFCLFNLNVSYRVAEFVNDDSRLLDRALESNVFIGESRH